MSDYLKGYGKMRDIIGLFAIGSCTFAAIVSLDANILSAFMFALATTSMAIFLAPKEKG